MNFIITSVDTVPIVGRQVTCLVKSCHRFYSSCSPLTIFAIGRCKKCAPNKMNFALRVHFDGDADGEFRRHAIPIPLLQATFCRTVDLVDPNLTCDFWRDRIDSPSSGHLHQHPAFLYVVKHPPPTTTRRSD
ncbi:unnamed protein product [Nesidiocoris tenuis]|uniref:Uncharacterized protein n=1 Tax=Nesidiocoris tenuis TaxID=355587 RepID=A0A6H5GR10_9HEMI|nr:unnamed protein product [Nesidiocoris tenuis]